MGDEHEGLGPSKFLIRLLVLFLFLLAVASAVKRVWGRGSPIPTSGESALDLLKKHYARGEISKEDFERIKRETE
jgi:putative membrane protein